VIARFEVRYRNYVAPDGSITRPLPAFASDANRLIALYRAMVLRAYLTRRLLHCSAPAGLGLTPFRSARRRYRLG
jgi:2-oxoisovalerate dehydrogenase E1 component alpha subunit